MAWIAFVRRALNPSERCSNLGFVARGTARGRERSETHYSVTDSLAGRHRATKHHAFPAQAAAGRPRALERALVASDGRITTRSGKLGLVRWGRARRSPNAEPRSLTLRSGEVCGGGRAGVSYAIEERWVREESVDCSVVRDLRLHLDSHFRGKHRTCEGRW